MPDAAETTVPVAARAPAAARRAGRSLVFVFGLLLVIALWVRKVKGAILISIVVTTVLAIIVEAIGDFGPGGAKNPTGWGLNVPDAARTRSSTPRTSALLGEFNLFGSFERVGRRRRAAARSSR